MAEFTPGGLRLRPAIDADREFTRSLHHACYRRWVEPIFGWDEAGQDRMFAESWTAEGRSVVELHGEAVGSLSVCDRGDHIFIADIEVHPDHQGRGLGTDLLRSVLADADARSLTVRLQVLKGNPARRLYERHRFVFVAETESHLVLCRPVQATGD